MEKRKRAKKEDPNPYTTQQIPTVPVPDEAARLILTNETLTAEKQWVQAGEILIRKTMTEQPATVPVDLGYEEVEIERVAANRILADGEVATPRQEGDAWIIPVVVEEAIVIKRRVVREEIRVRKRVAVRQEQISDVVRSEHIEVETRGRIAPQDDPGTPTAG